jgi:hypothetical protein
MPVEVIRRRILFHAAVVLLIGLSMGIPLAAQVANARGWMGAHLTTMITATFLFATGLVWRDIRLGPTATKLLAFLAISNGYVGALAGVVSSVGGIPGPVATGHQPTDSQMMVLGPFLAYLSISGIAWVALLVAGLRGSPDRA